MLPPAPGGPPDLAGSLAFLAAAATAVHAERDRQRLETWVLESALTGTGADAAGLWLGGAESAAWRAVGASSHSPALLRDPRVYPSLRPAVEGRGVVLVGPALDVADDRVRRLLPGITVLAVAVPAAGRPPHGVLALTRRVPDRFGEGAEALALAMAGHLGVALDNLAERERLSSREASQRSVFRQLQEAVFTPAPSVPHTELGMHFVASDESAPTGGDLFDWVVLPDGDLHLAVVDIMGKGVAATKDALIVTHALRLLVFDGCPLEDLVERADRLACAQNPDMVATLLVGRYDPRRGTVRMVGAGHPPALLVSGTSVRELPAPGIPIGWPGAGSFELAEATLERSDTLVLYTDGLVESTKDILEGIANLKRHAAETAGYPAANLARALVDRALKGAARHDDSLALVLRRRNPPALGAGHRLGPFEHRFTPSPASISLARHLLLDWLVRLPVDRAESEDLLLVASELCSNAVRHSTGKPGSVVLRARADGEDVVLEVQDDGGRLQLPDTLDEMPEPEAEQGRGLFLVQALADDLSSVSESGLTVVRARKRAVISAG